VFFYGFNRTSSGRRAMTNSIGIHSLFIYDVHNMWPGLSWKSFRIDGNPVTELALIQRRGEMVLDSFSLVVVGK
jgi:hypothetical protein